MFVLAALAVSAATGPATSQAMPPVCPVSTGPREVAEPPDVYVWRLPLNAGGEHELILTVHRDGTRFCYRYRLNGLVQSTQPTIRVHAGEHFALRLVNDIPAPSAGERLASSAISPCMPMAMPMPGTPSVRYVGYLNHPVEDRVVRMPTVDTNIHLHGFQGPAGEENIFLSTLSTPEHACEYHITIPRTQPPGTYFYHPHAHGVAEAQVGAGLSGAWIVVPRNVAIARADEHVIVLRERVPYHSDNPFAPDDTQLFAAAAAREKAMKPAALVKYDPFNPPAWPVGPMRIGSNSFDATGCNGNFDSPVVAVNDTTSPGSLTVAPARDQLLRIVNGLPDSAQLLRLRDSQGKPQQLRVVARDGISISDDDAHPLARYVATGSVLLAPASRADVLLRVAPGQTLTLFSDHRCGGPISEFALRHDILNIQAVATNGAVSGPTVALPERGANSSAEKLAAFARSHPDSIRRRAITFTEYIFPRGRNIPIHPAFYITDTTNQSFREHPFWPVYRNGGTVPANPDIVVKAGTIEEWWLVNATMEGHAFHVHQLPFVEEKTPDGMPLSLDVVFVPAGTLMPNAAEPNYPLLRPSITKVLLDFRHAPRGTFVFHCHMLFHEDHGMMGTVRVE